MFRERERERERERDGPREREIWIQGTTCTVCYVVTLKPNWVSSATVPSLTKHQPTSHCTAGPTGPAADRLDLMSSLNFFFQHPNLT